jgi:hypothetical protein
MVRPSDQVPFSFPQQELELLHLHLHLPAPNRIFLTWTHDRLSPTPYFESIIPPTSQDFESTHRTPIPKTHQSYPNPPQAPLILLANCISFCIMVTRFAWMAHKFVSSNRCTRKASAASCNAWIAWLCHRRLIAAECGRMSPHISRTRREKGSLSIRRSVDCWYRRISRRAMVPGL